MVHRMMSIPMTEEKFNREKRIIENLATRNNYNKDMINKLIKKYKCKKKRKRFTTLNLNDKEKNNKRGIA